MIIGKPNSQPVSYEIHVLLNQPAGPQWSRWCLAEWAEVEKYLTTFPRRTDYLEHEIYRVTREKI